MDEYVYVSAMGRTSKEPIIATRQQGYEVFLGGIWAAAKHAESFCGHVQVYSGNVTTTKRRYVHAPDIRKLFEVYSSREGLRHPLPDLKSFDLVIVIDFGHGCLTPELISQVCEEARYLAVSVQTNSANFGFNLLTKYPRADIAVVDEIEARLAAHDSVAEIESIIRHFAYPKMVITQGPGGSTGYDGQLHHAESVAERVIDTMGAGDAFLAVAGPLACAGAPMSIVLQAGNAAGAIKCGIVGHRQAVTKEALLSKF